MLLHFQFLLLLLGFVLKMTSLSTRVPVFEQRIDNIVGIAYAMDILEYVEKVIATSIIRSNFWNVTMNCLFFYL